MGAVLFSLHPASGTELWVVLDTDRVTTNGVAGFRDYPLGRQIASRALVGPVFAGAAVLLLSVTAAITGLILYNPFFGMRLLSGALSIVALSFAILIPAFVTRRFVLGTWFMPDPARGGIRHPVADLVWALGLASSAYLWFNGAGPSLNTPDFLLNLLGFLVPGVLVVICALAVQTFRRPDNDAGLRANIGILAPVCVAGEVAFWAFLLDWIGPVNVQLMTSTVAAAVTLVLLQAVAGVVLVRVSGTASGWPTRLAAAALALGHLDQRLWLVTTLYVAATAGATWLLGFAFWPGVLGFFLAGGLRAWLAIRWLGIVPWLVAQRASAREVAQVAAAPIRRWWDTP
jgi:hypothetical protein